MTALPMLRLSPRPRLQRHTRSPTVSDMTVVCVPDQESVELLGAVPDAVQVIAWDGEDERPADLASTTFWVPQVEDPGDLPRLFAAMPALEVIQLTSAGIENLVGRVPEGITLCDARGVHGG